MIKKKLIRTKKIKTNSKIRPKSFSLFDENASRSIYTRSLVDQSEVIKNPFSQIKFDYNIPKDVVVREFSLPEDEKVKSPIKSSK